ncbi:hypothetical protein MJ560_23155 [Klebsiella pneumoniae]|nr:hypothetical protein MJ560_23155 [Klebsiella pneumoniae]
MLHQIMMEARMAVRPRETLYESLLAAQDRFTARANPAWRMSASSRMPIAGCGNQNPVCRPHSGKNTASRAEKINLMLPNAGISAAVIFRRYRPRAYSSDDRLYRQG